MGNGVKTTEEAVELYFQGVSIRIFNLRAGLGYHFDNCFYPFDKSTPGPLKGEAGGGAKHGMFPAYSY